MTEMNRAPDSPHPDHHRSLPVRFEQVPLFRRLDLPLRAQSLAHNADCDLPADSPQDHPAPAPGSTPDRLQTRPAKPAEAAA